MPAPEISGFGDGAHAAGSVGLTIDGGGFGAFPGSVWIYENDDLTGAADEITVGSWNDIQLTVDIPASLNNAAGTCYLFVIREDLESSNAFEFTLEAETADREVNAVVASIAATAHAAVVVRGGSRQVQAELASISVTAPDATVTRGGAVIFLSRDRIYTVRGPTTFVRVA